LQIGNSQVNEWVDEFSSGAPFKFLCPPNYYRIKPGTDPGEHKPDPLIWGASIPGTEPVPQREEYVPLTDDEACDFLNSPSYDSILGVIIGAHRAGAMGKRTP
jgi:hypothetical protein